MNICGQLLCIFVICSSCYGTVWKDISGFFEKLGNDVKCFTRSCDKMKEKQIYKPPFLGELPDPNDVETAMPPAEYIPETTIPTIATIPTIRTTTRKSCKTTSTTRTTSNTRITSTTTTGNIPFGYWSTRYILPYMPKYTKKPTLTDTDSYVDIYATHSSSTVTTEADNDNSCDGDITSVGTPVTFDSQESRETTKDSHEGFNVINALGPADPKGNYTIIVPKISHSACSESSESVDDNCNGDSSSVGTPVTYITQKSSKTPDSNEGFKEIVSANIKSEIKIFVNNITSSVPKKTVTDNSCDQESNKPSNDSHEVNGKRNSTAEINVYSTNITSSTNKAVADNSCDSD